MLETVDLNTLDNTSLDALNGLKMARNAQVNLRHFQCMVYHSCTF